MASSSQRFFSFELGKNDITQLKKVFSLSLTIYGFIAITILLLAETIGLWFLNTQMVIPVERLGAANWVFQCSILSFIVQIITIPYNAAIIAHEHETLCLCKHNRGNLEVSDRIYPGYIFL